MVFWLIQSCLLSELWSFHFSFLLSLVVVCFFFFHLTFLNTLDIQCSQLFWLFLYSISSQLKKSNFLFNIRLIYSYLIYTNILSVKWVFPFIWNIFTSSETSTHTCIVVDKTSTRHAVLLSLSKRLLDKKNQTNNWRWDHSWIMLIESYLEKQLNQICFKCNIRKERFILIIAMNLRDTYFKRHYTILLKV
jgi:c-di-AMP phosphodiesterase-like protein